MIAPKHVGCTLHITAGQCTTNGGAADGFVNAVGARHEPQRQYFKIASACHVAQQLHIAAALITKVKIFANNHATHGQGINEHPLHKINWCFARLLGIKWHYQSGVNTG